MKLLLLFSYPSPLTEGVSVPSLKGRAGHLASTGSYPLETYKRRLFGISLLLQQQWEEKINSLGRNPPALI
jgi:hypothetical protein